VLAVGSSQLRVDFFRRSIAAVCTAVILTGCGLSWSSAAWLPLEPQTITLSIVGTNDLHGGVLAQEGRGGLALLAGYLTNLRAAREAEGGAVLLIDAGDMFQGTLESNLTEGAVVVAAYNALGYTAAAVGNHEFDFGPEGPPSTPRGPGDDARGALKARAAEAAFPLLAANLIDEATGRAVDWPNVRPSVLVERAGIRVGIIGVMTINALSATLAGNVKGLTMAPLAPTIAEHASRLRAAGADIVIVSAHAGGRCTAFDDPADLSVCDMDAEIVTVAQALPPALVDVIVGGHFHTGKAHIVNDIPIIVSYANGRAFGRVDLVVDRARRAVVERRVFAPRDLCAYEDPESSVCVSSLDRPGAVRARYEGRPVEADPGIAAVLTPAIEAAEAIKARPIGVVLEARVRRQAGGDSPLGNLFADALRAAVPDADAALHNTTGGLRADLPPGPLVYGSVYEVMPFDNRVVPLQLSGAELRHVLARQLQRTSRLVGVSGVQIRASCAGGELQVDLIRDSGAAVEDTERLVVAVSDFLATGGDDILSPVIPATGFDIPDDAPLARDAFADHLRSLGTPLHERAFAGVRTSVPKGLPVVCE
jgi:2',3'-cyclic-nucleotide 2'-phosphodiesterase (5'-nucleotidase family)